MSSNWTYEEMQRRLDASIQKDEVKQKILRAKREEKRAIKKAGGGKQIAAAIYSGSPPAVNDGTDFTFGHNEPVSNADSVDGHGSDCMGSVKCAKCGKFHGYCREVEEQKEKIKMLPSGDTQNTGKRKGGLNWISIEMLSTTPKEAKILMVKFNDEGTWGPRVNLKLAFDGTIAYLGMKPSKKDPRYKALTERFGLDENNWVNERILLSAVKDEFSEDYQMRLTIPDQGKMESRPTRGARS